LKFWPKIEILPTNSNLVQKLKKNKLKKLITKKIKEANKNCENIF